jgi:cobalt-zinc-cadmium efflux system outer membrane protein
MAALGLMAGNLVAGQVALVTLESVAGIVRADNPTLAAARFQIREAAGRLQQAGRMANPEIEAGIGHDPAFNEGKIELGVTQRFPVTRRLQLEKSVATIDLRAAEAEVREVERQLVASARVHVVKLLALRQRRGLLREQAGVSHEFARAVADIAAKGEGPALDAGQAKLEAAGMELEIHQLAAEEAVLLGELKPILGMQADTIVRIEGKLDTLAMPAAGGDPSRRPDLQKLKLSAEAAAEAVRLEEARRREDPEGAVFLGAERQEDAPEGFDTEAIAGVRLKIPWPLWNRNEGAVAEAQARAGRLAREGDALEESIRHAEASARATMRAWLGMIGHIDTTLMPLADAQAARAEQAYRGGQGELQAVLRAREKRLALAMSRLDAVREFHLARVGHESALGK